MRPYSSRTDRFSTSEIECFLRCHIPYRLEFLRRGAALRSDAGVRDPAIVEAALMAGRQLIQFLGLDIDFEDGGRPRLTAKDKKRYHYYWKDRIKYTDEVRIVNLGGQFEKLSGLDEADKIILAEFIHAADKSTAHLTESSALE